MGEFYIDKSKFKLAESYKKLSVQMITNFPHIIDAREMAQVHMNELRMYTKRQKLDQALERLGTVKDHWNSSLDAEDSDTAIMAKRQTATAEYYIGMLLKEQGKNREAVQYYQQAFNRLRDVMSIEDPDLREVADGLVVVNIR